MRHPYTPQRLGGGAGAPAPPPPRPPAAPAAGGALARTHPGNW